MPTAVRVKLEAWGLLSDRTTASSKPLTAHLEDYREALAATGVTEAHVALVTARASAVVKGAGFRRWGDIAPAAVLGFLAKLRGLTAVNDMLLSTV